MKNHIKEITSGALSLVVLGIALILLAMIPQLLNQALNEQYCGAKDIQYQPVGEDHYNCCLNEGNYTLVDGRWKYIEKEVCYAGG